MFVSIGVYMFNPIYSFRIILILNIQRKYSRQQWKSNKLLNTWNKCHLHRFCFIFINFFFIFFLKVCFCRVFKKISIRSSYVNQWGKHVTKTLKHLSWWWYLLCIICTSILFVVDLNLNIFLFVLDLKGLFVLLFYFCCYRSKPELFFV